MVAALVAGLVATAGDGLDGGSDAHACCDCAILQGSFFDVPRPRNTLVEVWGDRPAPRLKRVAPVGPSRRQRSAEWIALVPLGRDSLYRPAELLDLGATYELVVDGETRSHFTIAEEVDDIAPAFAGARSVSLRRYDRGSSCDAALGREIEIAYDSVPLDVAFMVVSVRRLDKREPPWRSVVGVGTRLWDEYRRDRTILSSNGCVGAEAPAIEIDARYCVSVVAHDAAGNASGGDVEVCDRVADCRPYTRDPIPECPRPVGALEFRAEPIDEIELKDASPERWLWGRARVAVHPLSFGVFVVVLVIGLGIAGRRWAQSLRGVGGCDGDR
jgi:hypothetical protein